ncbi:MAG: hypothetical protein JO104_07725 [Candidatus Eremiobacteraeota bacterium]|nr:hypothetical protein [Candidatus Eremiobacteraeota bacterium]
MNTIPVMAPPSPLLDAALSILADGKPRSADEILVQGQRLGLFDQSQTRKHVYTALSQYVERTLGRGRKPLIIEEPDRRFRLNRPIDDWPAIDTTGLPPLALSASPPQDAAPAIAALQAAAAGTNPDVFERAVCATFELFGFAATHVGGNNAPDGYADALLGELTYRVMLECKLARNDTISQSNAVPEAAKFRDAYRADYCALVAPSFDAEVTFVSELATHGVAAWSVDDLVRASTFALDCSRMRELFASGYAADPLDDFAWGMIHGSAKRLRTVASLLMEIGLKQQRMAHYLGRGAPPRLTVDVALSLVDDRLTTAGAVNGATRDEIDEAFLWLTSPYVDRALWTDASRTAIVIRPR